MADNRPTDEREQDRRILVTIIVDIREQLRFIVFKRRDLFRKEFRQYFPGPWNEIQARLLRAEHALQQPYFDWEYVEGAGLVRDSLQFKRNMLTQAIKQGVISRTLKIINSILGSLAKALP
jgi:hypothetical protein